MARWRDEEFDRGDFDGEFRVPKRHRRVSLGRVDPTCPDCQPGYCPCSLPEPPEPPGTPPDVKFLRWKAEQERKEAS